MSRLATFSNFGVIYAARILHTLPGLEMPVANLTPLRAILQGSLLNLRLFTLAIMTCSAAANERIRPLAFEQLGSDTRKELAFFVEGTEVAYLNREAIIRDTEDPLLKEELRHKTDDQLKSLIVEECAYISWRQIFLSGIRNTAIPIDYRRRKLKYVPIAYGRASVNAFSKYFLYEAKGDGLESDYSLEEQLTQHALRQIFAYSQDDLKDLDHSDGLASFGESISETTRQTAIQRSLDISKIVRPEILDETIETYFILRFPFKILRSRGQELSAALYARQAHFQRVDRRESNRREIYVGNVEETAFGGLVDFGIADPSRPELAQNFAHSDSRKRSAWDRGHEVAEAYDHGDKNQIDLHLKEMLAPLNGLWKGPPPFVANADYQTWQRIVARDPLQADDMALIESYARARDVRAGIFMQAMDETQLQDLWRSLNEMKRDLVANFVALQRFIIPHNFVKTFRRLRDDRRALQSARNLENQSGHRNDIDPFLLITRAVESGLTDAARLGAYRFLVERYAECLSLQLKEQITGFTLRQFKETQDVLILALEVLGRLRPGRPEVLASLTKLAEDYRDDAFLSALIIQTRWRNGSIKIQAEVKQLAALTRSHSKDLLADLAPVRHWISLEMADEVFELSHGLWTLRFEFWLLAPQLPKRVWSAIHEDFKSSLVVKRTAGGMKIVQFEEQFLAALLIASRVDSPPDDVDQAFAILKRGMSALFRGEFYEQVERVLTQAESPRLRGLLEDLHNSPPARYRAERQRLQQMKVECGKLL